MAACHFSPFFERWQMFQLFLSVAVMIMIALVAHQAWAWVQHTQNEADLARMVRKPRSTKTDPPPVSAIEFQMLYDDRLWDTGNNGKTPALQLVRDHRRGERFVRKWAVDNRALLDKLEVDAQLTPHQIVVYQQLERWLAPIEEDVYLSLSAIKYRLLNGKRCWNDQFPKGNRIRGGDSLIRLRHPRGGFPLYKFVLDLQAEISMIKRKRGKLDESLIRLEADLDFELPRYRGDGDAQHGGDA